MKHIRCSPMLFQEVIIWKCMICHDVHSKIEKKDTAFWITHWCKSVCFTSILNLFYLFQMGKTSWQVDSIQALSRNWKNHPLSLVLFSKTIKEEIIIEDNFACPDFYVQYAVWTLPLKIMFIQVDESKWIVLVFKTLW